MLKRLSLASSGLMLMLAGCGMGGGAPDDSTVESKEALVPASNLAGVAETVTTSGVLDMTSTFFQPLGTNDRDCSYCHDSQQGWTVTPLGNAKLFFQSQGLDDHFLPIDQGARPDADLSTFFSRLVNFGPTSLLRALTRFTRTNPATSEYDVIAVNDPSGFSTTASYLNFRRPSPTANEALVSSVTWTAGPSTAADPVGVALAGLVNGAANLHEQRTAGPIDPAIVQAQVDFQRGIFFAQSIDNLAGRLDTDGATGGPTNLMAQPFHVGINDIQGLDPAGQPFSPKIFNLYDAWAVYDQDGDHDHDHVHACAGGTDDDFHRRRVAAARASIYRGQQIFNTLQFNITGVSGLNDANVLGPSVTGTCGTCHNVPNVGGHSVIRMFDIGTADQINCGPMLPLVTIQRKSDGTTRSVCDLGRANGSHTWAQVGTFRAPPLRGLAAGAPYFHDGQAPTLGSVVDYHNNRFQIGLSAGQRRDLVAFLSAL